MKNYLQTDARLCLHKSHEYVSIDIWLVSGISSNNSFALFGSIVIYIILTKYIDLLLMPIYANIHFSDYFVKTVNNSRTVTVVHNNKLVFEDLESMCALSLSAYDTG